MPTNEMPIDNALPDTMVWRSELSYNEPLVEYYFRHPGFNNYPVVGVSWRQAYDFCLWRSDRVNEGIMMKKGYIAKQSLAGQQQAVGVQALQGIKSVYQGVGVVQIADLAFHAGLGVRCGIRAGRTGVVLAVPGVAAADFTISRHESPVVLTSGLPISSTPDSSTALVIERDFQER